MTYEIYRGIFVGGAVLAGIMLVVSLFLFFVFNIPHVIGDLTGANARRAIEHIRVSNEKNIDRTYRSSSINRERGRLTDKISHSGRIIKAHSDSLKGAMETEKIAQNMSPQRVGGEATTVLTEELSYMASETVLLSEVPEVSEETTLLTESNGVPFTVEYEITYIHTDEIIN